MAGPVPLRRRRTNRFPASASSAPTSRPPRLAIRSAPAIVSKTPPAESAHASSAGYYGVGALNPRLQELMRLAYAMPLPDGGTDERFLRAPLALGYLAAYLAAARGG